MRDSYERRRMAEIIKEEGILHGEFKKASGGETNIYFNLKRCCGIGEFVNLLKKEANKELIEIEQKNKKIYGLAGVRSGGTAFATAMMMERNQVMILVNLNEEPHITGNPENKPYVILDDVATKGGSIIKTAEFMKRDNLTPEIALVIVDREEGAKKNLAAAGIGFYSLFEASELL